MVDACVDKCQDIHLSLEQKQGHNYSMDENSIGSDAGGDDIASCILNAFDKLPSKFKPLHGVTTINEWVPLSGVVLQRGTGYIGLRFHALAYKTYR
jgi:hypothetical protein